MVLQSCALAFGSRSGRVVDCGRDLPVELATDGLGDAGLALAGAAVDSGDVEAHHDGGNLRLGTSKVVSGWFGPQRWLVQGVVRGLERLEKVQPGEIRDDWAEAGIRASLIG